MAELDVAAWCMNRGCGIKAAFNNSKKEKLDSSLMIPTQSYVQVDAL